MNKKLNILMLCHLPLKKTLGGSKVYIEAAAIYQSNGHNVTLLGIDELTTSTKIMDEKWRLEHFPQILKKYIECNIHKFDVIEFEALYLPFKIERNKSRALLVARSVLLELHLKKIKIPIFKSYKSLLSSFMKRRVRQRYLDKKIEALLSTCINSDLITVPNVDDKSILVEYGIEDKKIIVQPYGIFKSKFNENLESSKVSKEQNIIAFIGSFDLRKGAREFPEILKNVKEQIPGVKFKLIGACAMFKDTNAILDYFGEEFRNDLIIIESFDPSDLAKYLRDCRIGVFPSHLESFGFGVLEMMSFAIPVASYSCPGVKQLNIEEMSSPIGDYKSLSNVIVTNLLDINLFEKNKYNTLEKAKLFIYENQINENLKTYINYFVELQDAPPNTQN